MTSSITSLSLSLLNVSFENSLLWVFFFQRNLLLLPPQIYPTRVPLNILFLCRRSSAIAEPYSCCLRTRPPQSPKAPTPNKQRHSARLCKDIRGTLSVYREQNGNCWKWTHFWSPDCSFRSLTKHWEFSERRKRMKNLLKPELYLFLCKSKNIENDFIKGSLVMKPAPVHSPVDRPLETPSSWQLRDRHPRPPYQRPLTEKR